ncbi:MAG: type III-A CRISPR-associated protein Cas10/Csm1 [Pseudomonadales bacterium]|nr:type III-A CRISPR-associated protein Cas10/Csm1 [Pseudomonadales bacterium]
MNNSRLEAGSRVALAAYLHDLGKFVERANIEVAKEKYAIHEQMYCKKNQRNGATWYSHKHAAYTALGFEYIERYMPALKGDDFSPFGSMYSPTDADDSLVNASAMHHRPEGFLQWIVATADRAASGFEREEFERYNEAEEGTDTGKNHYQARLLGLLEQIRLEGNGVNITPEGLKYRYPLVPMSADGIFPKLRETCEPSDNASAQAEYKALWDGFIDAIKEIPESHQQQLPLWLDHFDTLWLTFTHAIPSATAFKTRPDVSLYDHSKTTAALATALWRYHADLEHDQDETTSRMKSREDWDEKKFLLIQGDFYGVQDFIFSVGSETNKRAAKLLRGRSFYVSLLTECAALKVLEILNLPSTSQITNAAGKFLIVAPNTDETKKKITEVQKEFDQWFLNYTYGRGGLGLAVQDASCNDFVTKKEAGFASLMEKLFRNLETTKYQQFGLCHDTNPPAVFSDYLESFDNTLGVCQIDPFAPAAMQENSLKLSRLSADHILLGEHLTRCKRLLISSEPLSESRYSLKVPVFGYFIHLTGNDEETGKFGPSARSGILRRAFDFSLPEEPHAVLWNGYSRRNINGYIPEFTVQDTQYPEKYKGADPINPGDIKTLNHIGCENRIPENGDVKKWVGINAVGTLKGDVDNLGAIFQKGLQKPTFAKMAALSRQMNNFFAVYLPSLCRKEYRNTYTVFAGGDDFFLIGPWRSQIDLANQLRKDFEAYCANNPDLHFSSGISINKPGLPISYLADNGESALELAKSYSPDGKTITKNAFSLFGQTVHWEKADNLLQACQNLESLADEYKLSTAYIYSLLQMIPMLENRAKPENSLWRSRLTYRTWRMLQQQSKGNNREQMLSNHQKIVKVIGEQGLQEWQGAYRIAIQAYLYQYR